MNATIGHAFVLLGLTASFLGAVATVAGIRSRRPDLVATARSWGALVVLGAAGAFAVMEVALFQRDYGVSYVTQVGSPDTPALYNFAALWSALEGSILLWALVLSGFLAAVLVKFRHRLTDPLVDWALVTLFSIATFFFALMAGPTNPFRHTTVPFGFEGPGPNPLLQNHLLVAFHPPMLYLGYVGFSVPFAFAVGALVTGRVGEGWLLEVRRWTVAAWTFLTLGIVLGAWWSYEVLGWGGYWAWDPVENASLLPWLTGTAFLHSVMVQERRGMLRVWNLSLVCATFSLTILGTFLTRSGAVASVHAFTAGSVGTWLLVFFALVCATSIGLIAWRGDRLRSPGAIDSPLSREASFLANNLLFGAFAAMVLLGTVFPLLMEAWDGTALTVGRPYFDSLARPLAFLVLFLMAIAPVLPWRKASGELLATRLFWPAVAALAAAAVSLAFGGRGLYPVLTFALGGFAAGAAVRQVALATRRQGWAGLVGRTNGGMIVHLGVVILAVGIAAAEAYSTDRTVTLAPGEQASVAGHELTYLELGADQNDRRTRVFARVQVDDAGVYEPAQTRFNQAGMLVGTPSVQPGVARDVYLVLDAVPDDPTAPVRLRVIVRPLVNWIWAGGIVMGLGSLLALVPGRRRRGTEPVSAPVPGAGRPAVPAPAAEEPSTDETVDERRDPVRAGG
jgi:cytochrome c-type biogenesis protein CcmF